MTTIRRAQGGTYYHGCMWFDHCYPSEPGYGYVGAIRFKKKNGIYLFGQIRRTDWIPVRHGKDDDSLQLYRSELSDADYDSDEEGRDACADRADGEGYLADSDDSGSDDSYLDYADLESYRKAKDAEYAFDEDCFSVLRTKHEQPGYQPTGTAIVDDTL